MFDHLQVSRIYRFALVAEVINRRRHCAAAQTSMQCTTALFAGCAAFCPRWRSGLARAKTATFGNTDADAANEMRKTVNCQDYEYDDDEKGNRQSEEMKNGTRLIGTLKLWSERRLLKAD